MCYKFVFCFYKRRPVNDGAMSTQGLDITPLRSLGWAGSHPQAFWRAPVGEQSQRRIIIPAQDGDRLWQAYSKHSSLLSFPDAAAWALVTGCCLQHCSHGKEQNALMKGGWMLQRHRQHDTGAPAPCMAPCILQHSVRLSK
jgi:hypothetical protein